MSHKPLIDHVIDAACKNPYRTALFEECTLTSFSYQQLLEDVEKVSSAIKRMQKFRDCAATGIETPLISIIFDRNYWSIVSILAILKSGGGYVPIDPGFPEDRQMHMLVHSQCKLAIVEDRYVDKLYNATSSSLSTCLPDMIVVDAKTGCLSFNEDIIVHPDDVLPTLARDNQSLAYVLYTSGSTGKPKGVMVRDISVVNTINFFADMLLPDTPTESSKQEAMLGLTTFCFDISVLEIFVPLTRGATLVLVSSATQKNPVKLTALLTSQQITVMQATPTTYEMMLGVGWPGPQGSSSADYALHQLTCLVGGEACRPSVMSLTDKVKKLVNVYGPTETTIWSSSQILTSEMDSNRIPVGAPISQTTFHLLVTREDNSDEKVKKMEEIHGPGEGELWIGGIGVARGYLHQPDLTVQRFLLDSSSASPLAEILPPHLLTTTLYCTGDLFRRTDQGDYVFQRRLDDQVKIKGYRIELAEVEAACLHGQHDLIQQAVAVVCREQLVVFVLLKASHPQRDRYLAGDTLGLTQRIQNTAREVVPHYMVPWKVIALEKYPTTANDKLDKLAMVRLFEERHPAPAVGVGEVEEDAKDPGDNDKAALTTALSTTSHKKSMVQFLAQAVHTISGFQPSPASSFAAVGIDSLAAMLFKSYLAQSLDNIEVDGQLLYDPNTTISSLAEVLYSKMVREKPEVLKKLHIDRAVEEEIEGLDEEQGGGGGDSLVKKAHKQSATPPPAVISALMLRKRILLEGMRGFCAVLILVDHFFYNSTVYGLRVRSDTSYFLIITGFATCLQELAMIEATESVEKANERWNPWSFLYSRWVGLFPIYWLVLLLHIPYIYVLSAKQVTSNIALSKILTLYILGLQEWTKYDNTLLRGVYYVSLVWGVFQIYAVFATIWKWGQQWHQVYKWLGTVSVVGFLIGMLIYNTTGGIHCPMGVVCFYLGYAAAMVLNKVLIQQQQQGSSTGSNVGMSWTHYTPAFLTDLMAFVLLFFTFFHHYDLAHDGAPLKDPQYSAYDLVMTIYGNPILFTLLLFLTFFQAPSHEYSIFSFLLSRSKLLPLLGECSLSIYILQLDFMTFYYARGISGIKQHEYPYSRHFEVQYPLLYQEPRYFYPGLLAVILLGIFLQKVYQDKLVARLHLWLMQKVSERKQQQQVAGQDDKVNKTNQYQPLAIGGE